MTTVRNAKAEEIALRVTGLSTWTTPAERDIWHAAYNAAVMMLDDPEPEPAEEPKDIKYDVDLRGMATASVTVTAKSDEEAAKQALRIIEEFADDMELPHSISICNWEVEGTYCDD